MKSLAQVLRIYSLYLSFLLSYPLQGCTPVLMCILVCGGRSGWGLLYFTSWAWGVQHITTKQISAPNIVSLIRKDATAAVGYKARKANWGSKRISRNSWWRCVLQQLGTNWGEPARERGSKMHGVEFSCLYYYAMASKLLTTYRCIQILYITSLVTSFFWCCWSRYGPVFQFTLAA